MHTAPITPRRLASARARLRQDYLRVHAGAPVRTARVVTRLGGGVSAGSVVACAMIHIQGNREAEHYFASLCG